MDGYEASRRIRSMQLGQQRTSIIALTADAFDENRKKCEEAGMDDFLSKPIMENVLLATLQRWIKRWQFMFENKNTNYLNTLWSAPMADAFWKAGRDWSRLR